MVAKVTFQGISGLGCGLQGRSTGSGALSPRSRARWTCFSVVDLVCAGRQLLLGCPVSQVIPRTNCSPLSHNVVPNYNTSPIIRQTGLGDFLNRVYSASGAKDEMAMGIRRLEVSG